MKFISEKYGNIVQTDAATDAERDMELRMDKNRIVTAACRIRRRKKEIRSFANYEADIGAMRWTLDIIATPAWHKRFKALLANPAPVLAQWAEEDRRKAERAYKKLARAVRRAMPNEGSDTATEREATPIP